MGCSVTEQAAVVLTEARAKIRERVVDVLDGRGPPHLEDKAEAQQTAQVTA